MKKIFFLLLALCSLLFAPGFLAAQTLLRWEQIKPISAQLQKTTPVANDLILIEDSQDADPLVPGAGKRKYVKFSKFKTDLTGIRDTVQFHRDSLRLAFDSIAAHNLRLIAVEGKDTTGIYHANRALLDAIDETDTTRWGTGGADTDEQNLTYAAYSDKGIMSISGGTGDTIPPVSYTKAGLMLPGDKRALDSALFTIPSTIDTLIINNGALYNWWSIIDTREITSSSDWIVPRIADWDALRIYVGGYDSPNGGKLKETGTTYWGSQLAQTTNETGFNGRGAGQRTGGGVFSSIRTLAAFSSFDLDLYFGIPLTLNNTNNSIGEAGYGAGYEKTGKSVRLLYTGAGTPTSYTGNDGKVYRVVTIGSQIWLADNLTETKYRNGDWITGYDAGVYTPISNSTWAALDTSAMCFYADNPDNAYSIITTNNIAVGDTLYFDATILGTGTEIDPLRVDTVNLIATKADLLNIVTEEIDPVFAADSANILHWSDTLNTTKGIVSAYDLNTGLAAKQNTLTTGNLTESITGLEFDQTRQVIGGAAALSLTTGYGIPTTTQIGNIHASGSDNQTFAIDSTAGSYGFTLSGTTRLHITKTTDTDSQTLAADSTSSSIGVTASSSSSRVKFIVDRSSTNELQTLAIDSTSTTIGITNSINNSRIHFTKGTGADNWGTDTVRHDNTLIGKGTVAVPLKVDTTAIFDRVTEMMIELGDTLVKDATIIGVGSLADPLRADTVTNVASKAYAKPQTIALDSTASTYGIKLSGTNSRVHFNKSTGTDSQTLSRGTKTGTDQPISISNGNTIHLNVADPDSVIGNEYVNVVKDGVSIATRQKIDVQDSTGIVVTSTDDVTNGRVKINIRNSAPDQTVSLTQAGATTITGTYPNFTISSTDTNTDAQTLAADSTSTSIGVTASGSSSRVKFIVDRSSTNELQTLAVDSTASTVGITASNNNSRIHFSVVKTEVDPIFAGDSAKILHWSDTTITNKGIASKYNLLGKKDYHGIQSTGTVSFSNSTHVLTIGAGTNIYWYKGTKYQIASAITSDIDSYETLTANTLYYFYFDAASGTLKASDAVWDFDNNVFVATVFWNGSAGAIQDERHSYSRDLDWHKWAHTNIGTVYKNDGGASITYPSTAVDGSLQIETGTFADEDISFATGQETTMRGWYKTNSTTFTFADYALPFVGTTNQPQYLDTDTYTLTNVGGNDYVKMFVYATNDLDRNLYFVPTHAATAFNNLADARNSTAITYLGTNLNAEFKLLYAFIYKGDGQFQEAVDYRTSTSLPGGGIVSQISASSVLNTPAGNIAASDVQSALNELDSELKAKSDSVLSAGYATNYKLLSYKQKSDSTGTDGYTRRDRLTSALIPKLDKNIAIVGGTNTKITYDAKGLVTSGSAATTADIADSSNKRYVTDTQLSNIHATGTDLQTATMDSTATTYGVTLSGNNSRFHFLKSTGTDSQTLSIDSTATDYEINISGGNRIHFSKGSGTGETEAQTLTYSADVTHDYAAGNNAIVTLTGNMTSYTLENVPDGGKGEIVIIQDSNGGYTLDAIVVISLTVMIVDTTASGTGTSQAVLDTLTAHNNRLLDLENSGGGTMVYPAAGLAKSTGSAWTTSITDNSANWNTAYGWGNHSGLYWAKADTTATLETKAFNNSKLALKQSLANMSNVTSTSTNKYPTWAGTKAYVDSVKTTIPTEVVDEAYSAANFNGGTAAGVSQDDFYDYANIADTDDNGKANVVDLATAGVITTDASGVLSSAANIANQMRLSPFLFTDFMGPANAGTVEASMGWDYAVIASGTQLIEFGESNHPGSLKTSSSTTTNSGGYCLTGSTSIKIAGSEVFEIIFKHRVASGTNTTFRFGFLGGTTTVADAVNGCYFEIPSGSLSVVGKTANASTRSTTATIYTISISTWYRAKVEVNSDATLVTFKLFNESGSELGSQTLNTNIPTATMACGFIVTNVGTSATELGYWDMMMFYYNRILTR